MNILSIFFGKKSKAAPPPAPTEAPQRPVDYSPRTFELVYDDETVGLHHKESGMTEWLPWCLFQNVAVIASEPVIEGEYVYDIMAEFQHMDVEWEVNGFHGFLDAMSINLDNFDIETAKNAIHQLSRARPRAIIYVSSNYPEDITTRAGWDAG